MRTYFINNGDENEGPFTLDELKDQQINKATLVWFHGMEQWNYATEIPELKSFFIATPPPIQKEKILQKNSSQNTSSLKVKSNTILGFKKKYFYLACLFVSLFIIILILNYLQQTKKSALEIKNKQTEFSNVKIDIQQKESNQDRIQQEIENRIIHQNTNKRRKDSINLRIQEIKVLLSQNRENLSATKENLKDTEGFKLLRTENAKKEQIATLQNEIKNKNTTIDQLNSEINRLYLVLETIH